MTAVSERVEHVRQWRASGETTRAYAQRQGLKESSLRYWATRYRGLRDVPKVPLARVSRPGERAHMVGPQRAPVGSSYVVPLAVSPACNGSVTLEIGAVRMVVRPGFDAELLRQVVAALGGGR